MAFFKKILRCTVNRQVSFTAEKGVRRTISMWKAISEWVQLKAENSQTKYNATLEELCRFLEIPRTSDGEKMLIAIDATDINRYVNWCKTRPARLGRSSLVSDRVSDVTVGHKVKILASIFQHLVDSGRMHRNPWRLAQREFRGDTGGDRSRTEMVPFEKVQEIFNLDFSATPRDRQIRAVLAAGFGGGLRAGEIIGLRLLDVSRFTMRVQEEQGERTAELVRLRLRRTKKGKADDQTLPEWASALVLTHLEQRRKDGAKDMSPLFTPYQHGYASERIVTHRSLQDWFATVMRRVGLGSEFTPHSMRATPITYLLEKGLPHRDVQKFSRHSSVKMVEHYDKMRDKGAEKISALNDLVKTRLAVRSDQM